MGYLQIPVGLGFTLTAIAYVIGGIVFAVYVDQYFRRLTTAFEQS